MTANGAGRRGKYRARSASDSNSAGRLADTPGFTRSGETAAGGPFVLPDDDAARAALGALTGARERFKSTADAGAVPGLHGRESEFGRFMGDEAFDGRVRRFGVGRE